MTFQVPTLNRVDETICQKWKWPLNMATDPSYGNNGAFLLNAPLPNRKMKIRNRLKLLCIASDGLGWEHVSVSLLTTRKIPDWRPREPTWQEMCFVKAAFWSPEDRVIQIHPPESEYVNMHPHCLHLWRPSHEHPVFKAGVWDAWLWPDPLLVGPITTEQPVFVVDDPAAQP